jgi:2-methylisocitrate lyase-like PEP mutase family enzyme
VNALPGIKGLAFSVAELEAAGVRRISLGSVLSRVALGGLLAAAREMREKGTFTFVDQTTSMAELGGFMIAPRKQPGIA